MSSASSDINADPNLGYLFAASQIERQPLSIDNPLSQDALTSAREQLGETARLNSLAACQLAGYSQDDLVPDHQALIQHATQVLNNADKVLYNLITKHADVLLKSHFIVVALAGAEMRDTLTGMKEDEQYILVMHAYLRWVKIYETMLQKPPHDERMFFRPNDFPHDL
ncbi:hypothetical protein B484DRAFT_404189, partial [Ochromonadaceae sp. CCMP2298]